MAQYVTGLAILFRKKTLMLLVSYNVESTQSQQRNRQKITLKNESSPRLNKRMTVLSCRPCCPLSRQSNPRKKEALLYGRRKTQIGTAQATRMLSGHGLATIERRRITGSYPGQLQNSKHQGENEENPSKAEKNQPDPARGFSVLVPGRDYRSPSVTIGIYSSV